MSPEQLHHVEQLTQSLKISADAWRHDYDEHGLDYFGKSLDELDFIVGILDLSDEERDQLQLALLSIYHAVLQQDIVAMVDSIEFDLLTVANGWKSVGERT
jgi:hypothetical protein